MSEAQLWLLIGIGLAVLALGVLVPLLWALGRLTAEVATLDLRIRSLEENRDDG